MDAFAEDILHVLVAHGIYLNKDGVATRGVVTLHNLWYLLHFGHHLIETASLFKEHTNEGTSLITYLCWREDKLGTFDDTNIDKPLHTLVNGRTRHSTHTCHLKKGNASITHNEFEYLTVESIDAWHTFVALHTALLIHILLHVFIVALLFLVDIVNFFGHDSQYFEVPLQHDSSTLCFVFVIRCLSILK